MNESQEISLRRLERDWQSKQDSAGVVTLFQGFLTVGAFMLFLCAPSAPAAGVLIGSMALLLISCVRLLSSAAKVVEIQKTRNPSRSNPPIIEAEVIEGGNWPGEGSDWRLARVTSQGSRLPLWQARA